MKLLKLLLFICCFLPLLARAWGIHENTLDPQFRKWQPPEVNDILPLAQQLLLVRDNLVPLLENYKTEHPGDVYSHQMIGIIKRHFPQHSSHYRAKENWLAVYFEYSVDERFLVNDIETDRLAVNTEDAIHFNMRGLMKKSSLGIAETVQLWLHELSHFDKSTPLEVRDKWVATVAQWVRERSGEFIANNGKRILTLTLPANRKLPEAIARDHTYNGPNNPEELHIQEVQKDFLLLEQDQEGTRFMKEGYQVFQTFRNFIKKAAKSWDNLAYDTLTVVWPRVEVHSIKQLPNGKIQIDYSQSSHVYGRDLYDHYKFTPGKSWDKDKSINPNFPIANYRTEFNPENNEIDIKRSYSRPLKDGEFELNRVQDNGSKRYLSLRVKLQNIVQEFKKSPSLHLVGKDPSLNELLSFEIKQWKIVSPNEALIHIQVPARNFEISQILLPRLGPHGSYSELKILPSGPFSLFSSTKFKKDSSHLDSPTILEKQSPDDKVNLELPIKTSKKVVGVTIDMEHSLLAQQSHPTQLNRKNTLDYIGEGRKYFIKGSDLRTNKGSLSFAIPEAQINQIQEGPEKTQKIAWCYTRVCRTQAYTMIDTDTREIKALWVHFSDGTVAKLPESKLPPGRFNLRFDPNKVRIRECKDLFNEMFIDTSYADSYG